MGKKVCAVARQSSELITWIALRRARFRRPGALILSIHRSDATASFTTFLFQMLGLLDMAGGLGAGLNQVNQKVEAVQQQTKGILSKTADEIVRLNEEVARLNRQLHPEDGDGR